MRQDEITQVTVLIVDDDPGNLKMLNGFLRQQGFRVLLARDGWQCLESAEAGQPDLILLDILMPGMDGFDTCRKLKASPETRDIPVIFLSALAESDHIIKGFSAGGVDYITKPFRREEVMARLSTHATLRRQKKELKFLHDRLDSILKYSPSIITVMDANCRYLHINPAGQKFFDLPEERIIGHCCRDFLPPEIADRFQERIRTVLNTGQVLEVEDTFRSGPRQRIFSTMLYPLPGKDDDTSFVGGIARDVTEWKKAEQERLQMERRLHAVQRLESLGVMAGGIAHDFNNKLMVVLGNIELAQDGTAGDSPERKALEASEHAVLQAADLIRRMLAYTGNGNITLTPLNIETLITTICERMKFTVHPKTALQFRTEKALPQINGDESQIRQIMINLIRNAVESYPDETRGPVTVSAGVRFCDEAYLADTFPDVWLGYEAHFSEKNYVCIDVTDQGGGMSEEEQKRAFDPFFTTKFPGRGLGLSMVLGIVRGHGGYIRIDSEPGKGTTVRVLLPVAAEASLPAETPVPAQQREIPEGSGLVLLVDDEEQVRRLVRHMLMRLGYSVICASGGREALNIFRDRQDVFDLVLLDLTMPCMSGLELFEQLQRIEPAVPVVLSSGYSRESLKNRYGQEGFAGFLQKPYRSSELGALLKDVIGRNPQMSPAPDHAGGKGV